jgi:hypothetical protein
VLVKDTSRFAKAANCCTNYPRSEQLRNPVALHHDEPPRQPRQDWSFQAPGRFNAANLVDTHPFVLHRLEKNNHAQAKFATSMTCALVTRRKPRISKHISRWRGHLQAMLHNKGGATVVKCAGVGRNLQRLQSIITHKGARRGAKRNC